MRRLVNFIRKLGGNYLIKNGRFSAEVDVVGLIKDHYPDAFANIYQFDNTFIPTTSQSVRDMRDVTGGLPFVM